MIKQEGWKITIFSEYHYYYLLKHHVWKPKKPGCLHSNHYNFLMKRHQCLCSVKWSRKGEQVCPGTKGVAWKGQVPVDRPAPVWWTLSVKMKYWLYKSDLQCPWHPMWWCGRAKARMLSWCSSGLLLHVSDRCENNVVSENYFIRGVSQYIGKLTLVLFTSLIIIC